MTFISFETSLRVKNLVVMMLAFFGRAYSRRLRKTIINSSQAVVVNLGGQNDIHERHIYLGGLEDFRQFLYRELTFDH